MNRLHLSPALVFLILLGIQAEQPSIAADVLCDYKYAGGVPSELVAHAWWPSGFRPSPVTCYRGHIHGVIEKGDYEKVRAFYRANHPGLGSFSLDSPGGDVEEALKIGRLFRKYLLSVWARYGLAGKGTLPYHNNTQQLPCHATLPTGTCTCASACALVWLGGVARDGVVWLHRPRTDDQLFRKLPAAEASQVYRAALDTIVAYLREMEAPTPVIDAMISTGSAEVTLVNSSMYGLERVPSIAEWVDAVCGSFTEQECDRLIRLQLYYFDNKLPRTRPSFTRR
jgi:hypothetical protein